MIRSEGELCTPEIRPEVRTHYHRCQHFSAGCTISSLRQPQAMAGVCDHHFPILLHLAQDPSHSKQAGVRVKNQASAFCGKTQDRSVHEACLQSLKCRLLPVRPYKGGSLPRQSHQGLCQIFHKSPIVSDKANELPDTFDLIGGMPVLYRRLLRGITRQACAAHNMSQENHFCLHECTFLCL